jgi:hypothetical protein
MIRGTRPKPVKLKLVTGNPGKRPLNAAEPQAPALAGIPAHLDGRQRLLWTEIIEAAPAHVLTQADRLVIELTVRLLHQLRTAADVGPGLAVQLTNAWANSA